MFTLPSWMPLAEMSVNTLPLTRSFCEPLFSPSPAPPRCTNESLVNWMCWSKLNDTFAGVCVHAAYGQVPWTLAGATSHSAWRAAPSGPVTWYVAWISENPSPEFGPSHVAYENWMPLNTMCWTGVVALPLPSTSFSSTGASTSAVARFSPERAT